MKKIALSEVKDDLVRYLRLAKKEPVDQPRVHPHSQTHGSWGDALWSQRPHCGQCRVHSYRSEVLTGDPDSLSLPIEKGG